MIHFKQGICILFFLLASLTVFPTDNVPRDTSFTVHQTFDKEKKKFPFIQIAQAELPEGVIAFEDVVYAVLPDSPYGKRELHVNLYRPDDKQKYPAILMIHGGGWNSGNLTLQIPMAQKIAGQGYVAIPIEYRLIPEALYPAGLHDIKTAVKWLRINADKYGIDTSRIAVSGCSAGAQLASLAGMTNGSARHEDKLNNPANVSSDVQAVINIDGILDFTREESTSRAETAREEGKTLPIDAVWLGGTYKERSEIWKEASPIYWANPQSPPICFINSSIPRFHGGRDELIEKLDQWNIYSEVHTIPDTPHPFWFFHPWHQTTVNYMVNFLNKVFKPNALLADRSDYDFVVAQDGSGDFRTIQEAIDAVPDYRKQKTAIFIRNGIYREKIIIPDTKQYVALIGEDQLKTVISYDDFAAKKNNFGEELGTSGTGSIYISGDNFYAENITFENASGPVGQAVAAIVKSDKASFINCRFIGFQDTLYTRVPSSRQYYKNCYIEGTVDFIFGWSVAFFDNCEIFCKNNGYITAASTPEDQAFGYVFYKCKITGNNPGSFYLGRPWRPYAKVAFIECMLGDVIKPEGWNNWGKANNEQTATYLEYNNSGPGANISKRVSWSRILTDDEVKNFTLQNIMKKADDDWLPLRSVN